MPTDWNPNTPDMKGEFNATEPERNPISKLEMNKLEAARETPDVSLKLIPPGIGQTQSSNDNIREEREKRIDYIKDRLNKQKNRSRDSFRRS